MPLEVACGACQGRLVVESPGVVVACPHCGHHLTAPDFPVDSTEDSVAADAPPEPAGESAPIESGSIFDEPLVGSEGPDTIELRPAHRASVTEPADEDPAGDALPEQPSVSTQMHSRRPDTVPRTLFLVLLSYASAVTLACVWLFYQLQNVPLHNLERLPDPVESARGAGRSLTLVAVDSPMPAGHTLTLRQTQRFGHIRVTPLRVSRESLEFEPLQQFGAGASRAPIGPVLKLWLKLENASSDQKIAPLDRTLMLSRLYEDDRVMANNFLRPGNGTAITLLHDNPIEGNWNWKGQGADGLDGKVLEPGGSFETYVPTGADGIDELTGPLVWRIHIRKGYSGSGRGVTTLFEVAFDSTQIESD